MKNQLAKKLNIFIVLIVVLIGGIFVYYFFIKNGNKDLISTKNAFSEDLVFKEDNTTVPEWITNDPMLPDNGPWYDSLYISISEDGLNFSNERLFLPHSGVGNIMLTSDGILISIFQYFSYSNQELFDVIAYVTSEDFGKTWSSVKALNISGLSNSTACDPTLVQLPDNTLRLYFTYHKPGEQYPQLYSAISTDIDGTFKIEGKQLETEEIILDPAVVYFDGKWHHYTVKHGDSFDSTASNVHSVSDSGVSFKLRSDIDINFQMLGDVIVVDDMLRFYNGRESAISDDGYLWEKEPGIRLDGADPGVVQLPDESYIAIYTKP